MRKFGFLGKFLTIYLVCSTVVGCVTYSEKVPRGSDVLQLEQSGFGDFALVFTKSDFLSNNTSNVSQPISFLDPILKDRWIKGFNAVGISFDRSKFEGRLLKIHVTDQYKHPVTWKDGLWITGSALTLFLVPYWEDRVVTVSLRDENDKLIGEKSTSSRTVYQTFLVFQELSHYFRNTTMYGLDDFTDIEAIFLTREILNDKNPI